MFRLTKKGDLFTHVCVNCGCTVQYRKYGPEICKHCKTVQDFFDMTKSTDIPCSFMTGDAIWRVWYHVTRTNDEMREY